MKNAKEKLLSCLGDEDVAAFYYNRILECKNARELFDEVIVPLINSRSVTEEEARKKDFYMTLAKPMEVQTGTKVNKSTLHGYIDKHFVAIGKEEKTQTLVYRKEKPQDGVMVELTTHQSGYLKFQIKLQISFYNLIFMKQILKNFLKNYTPTKYNRPVNYRAIIFY